MDVPAVCLVLLTEHLSERRLLVQQHKQSHAQRNYARTPTRSLPGSLVRRPTTAQPIPLRIPGTWDSARIDRIQPPLGFSAERLALAFRVPSARSPRRSVEPPRNQEPKARPQSSAIAPHLRRARESLAMKAATRTTAQRMQRTIWPSARCSLAARHKRPTDTKV